MKNLLFTASILAILSCASVEESNKNENSADSNEEFKTHYEVYGEGTPLLIINGGPGMSSEGFRPLAKTFGKKYRAIIYDQRGTGKSRLANPSEENVSLDVMIEDLENLRKELKIEKWFVLGHSFGGMLGSYYATKHPNSIQGLILSASGGYDLKLFETLDIRGRLSKSDQDSLDYYQDKMDAGDTTFATKIARGKHLAPAYLYKKEFVDQIAVRLTQANYEINGLVFQDMIKVKFDCAEELSKFTKPTLIIQGREDIIPIVFSMSANEIIPNSRLEIIPECAHYPWLEQPDIYFGTIGEFVEENK